MKLVLFALSLFFSASVYSNVETLIIDTGPGHASVTRFPNGDIMVFDTGHWSYQSIVMEKFAAFIGDADIDLLITSHSDADHLATTDELLNNYQVHRVIRPGKVRDTATWRSHNDAIVTAGQSGLTHDINLANTNLPIGTVFNFGGASVTYLSGFHEPPVEWNLEHSEFLNAGSIVVRVLYNGHSILFTGDAVGREEGSAADAPAIATERLLIDNAVHRPVQSDVLIVPHHGSDDASSTEFIEAVAPRWVIFPAGHKYHHPVAVTAKRFTDLGYNKDCMLRTDLGDNEGGKEWSHGATGTGDKANDDHISIVLQDTGDPIVRYVGGAAVNCPAVLSVSVVQPTADNVIIKKSRSGICHTPASSWYSRTKNFDAFTDLASCLASGGRLPN